MTPPDALVEKVEQVALALLRADAKQHGWPVPASLHDCEGPYHYCVLARAALSALHPGLPDGSARVVSVEATRDPAYPGTIILGTLHDYCLVGTDWPDTYGIHVQNVNDAPDRQGFDMNAEQARELVADISRWLATLPAAPPAATEG